MEISKHLQTANSHRSNFLPKSFIHSSATSSKALTFSLRRKYVCLREWLSCVLFKNVANRTNSWIWWNGCGITATCCRCCCCWWWWAQNVVGLKSSKLVVVWCWFLLPFSKRMGVYIFVINKTSKDFCVSCLSVLYFFNLLNLFLKVKTSFSIQSHKQYQVVTTFLTIFFSWQKMQFFSFFHKSYT